MYAVFIFVFRSKEIVYVRIYLFMVFSNELHR